MFLIRKGGVAAADSGRAAGARRSRFPLPAYESCGHTRGPADIRPKNRRHSNVTVLEFAVRRACRAGHTEIDLQWFSQELPRTAPQLWPASRRQRRTNPSLPGYRSLRRSPPATSVQFDRRPRRSCLPDAKSEGSGENLRKRWRRGKIAKDHSARPGKRRETGSANPPKPANASPATSLPSGNSASNPHSPSRTEEAISRESPGVPRTGRTGLRQTVRARLRWRSGWEGLRSRPKCCGAPAAQALNKAA